MNDAEQNAGCEQDKDNGQDTHADQKAGDESLEENRILGCA